MQIGVMDKDFLSKDDFMGELRITIADLKAQTNNEIKTFSLSTQGTIDLMTGSRVQDAVLNHEVDSSDWGSVVAWSASLQAVFETDQMTGEAIYWKNQVGHKCQLLGFLTCTNTFYTQTYRHCLQLLANLRMPTGC